MPRATTVAVGQTTTVSPGQAAAVTNSGTPSDKVLDFEIPQGETGDPGADGTDPGLLYSFDDGTAPTPVAGNVRADNADLSAATALYFADEDRSGNDHAAFLAGVGGSTSTLKGYVALKRASDGVQTVFEITGAANDETDYVTVPVSYVSGATSFSNDDALSAEFLITGDAGDGDVDSVNGQVPSGGDVTLNASHIPNDSGVAGATVDVALDALATGVAERLEASANLSDLDDAVAARGSLGLGDSATRNVGTGAGDVAAGDHSHDTDQIANESDIPGATTTDALNNVAAVTVAEGNVSGISALDLEGIAPHYRALEFYFDSLVPATDGDGLLMRFGIDGAYHDGGSDYSQDSLVIGTSSGAAPFSAVSSFIRVTTNVLSNGSNRQMSGRLTVHNLNSSARCHVTGLARHITTSAAGSERRTLLIGGHREAAAAFNCIRFFMSSGGNFAINYRLVGIR